MLDDVHDVHTYTNPLICDHANTTIDAISKRSMETLAITSVRTRRLPMPDTAT